MEQKPKPIQHLVWFHAGPPRLELYQDAAFLCLAIDGVLQSKMNQLAPATNLSAHLEPILQAVHRHKPERLLQLGLGGGDLNRFIGTVSPATQLLTVEKNVQVVEIYQRFFCLQGKEQIVVLAAEDFLRHNEQQWDFIVWDIYPLFHGWQHSVKTLLQQNAVLWFNLSQPEQQQELEVLLQDHSYCCHQIPGYLNLLYEINCPAKR